MMRPDARASAAHRIAAAKAASPDLFRGYIKPHPKFPDVTDAVLCKGCGAPIRGLVEDERFEDVRRLDGGRVVVYKKLVFACLPNYGERTIEFDDGSRHVTNGCLGCLNKLTDADLEAWYASDLAELEQLERRGAGPVPWAAFADRKPVRIVKD
jgi:hypothetical protein